MRGVGRKGGAEREAGDGVESCDADGFVPRVRIDGCRDGRQAAGAKGRLAAPAAGEADVRRAIACGMSQPCDVTRRGHDPSRGCHDGGSWHGTRPCGHLARESEPGWVPQQPPLLERVWRHGREHHEKVPKA